MPNPKRTRGHKRDDADEKKSNKRHHLATAIIKAAVTTSTKKDKLPEGFFVKKAKKVTATITFRGFKASGPAMEIIQKRIFGNIKTRCAIETTKPPKPKGKKEEETKKK